MGKFRYKITSPVADAAYIDAPDGWKDSESIFPRSETYKGIFRKFAANDLTFKTDGAAKLREINAVDNFESEAEFIQEEKDFDDYTWFERFRGKFDFVKYKSIDGNEGRNVSINVIDSGFWNTVKNREDIKPQLNQLTSLDGFQISGFTNEEIFITLDSIPTILTSSLITGNPPIVTNAHSVPLTIASSEDPNAIAVVETTDIITVAGAFYVVNTVNELKITVEFDTTFEIIAFDTTLSLKLKHYNQAGVQQNAGTDVLVTNNAPAIYPASVLLLLPSTDYDFDTLSDGDYFILSVEGGIVTNFKNIAPYLGLVATNANVDELPEIQVSGMLIHELLSRELQIISGVDIPLYSEILGRNNSEPRSYDSDGDMSNLFVTSGERIRGFTREESPLTLGFKETFESLYALNPICSVIEKINGIDNLRVEEIKYAFDNRIILTIDNASNIKESYLSDRIFSRILVGFESAEYEEKDGLFEYNQKSEFSTPISVVNNDYNIVSKIGADTNSINNARAKNKAEFPSEDTRYDNRNYFITVIKNDSALSNSDFESWSDDNTPDDWDIIQGTVLRKYILGSNRCLLESGFFGAVKYSQSKVFSVAQKLGFKISYENLDGYLSGDGSIGFSIELDTGSAKYSINGFGEWEETAVTNQNWFGVNIPRTPENELQSLLTYAQNTPIMPGTGTITVSIFGSMGVITDDVYIGDAQYLAKTTEGYTSIQNAIFGGSSLNLDISPARNLRKHGSIIRACAENKLSQYLKFNSSEKNSTLSTQKDSESSPVVENADIQIADLAEPFFKPNQIDFNMVFDKAVIDVLNETFAGETKPKYLGMVRFRKNTSENYRYVWLLNPNTGGESQLGKMSGVEVNTDYVTPVEI